MSTHYLAGGDSRSTSTDHSVCDSVITPVILTLSRGEQRQGSLLEIAGARCKTDTWIRQLQTDIAVHFFPPLTYKFAQSCPIQW